MVEEAVGPVALGVDARLRFLCGPINNGKFGERHSTVVAFALRNPAAPGSNISIPKKIFLLLDVAELIDSIRRVCYKA